MQRKHDVRAQQTLEVLNSLIRNKINKCSLLIRHSERYFCEDARMEPFMGLTENGKTYSEDFGKKLNSGLSVELHSSFFGRCIETAYLIDKGFSQTHRISLPHNRTHDTLAPFYIKDIEKAINMVDAQGSELFLRNWFDYKIDESIMLNPETAADRLCNFMYERLDSLPDKSVAICVSHDWNIFPIKEFKMEIPHETSGDIGYLDGLLFFESNGKFQVVNFQSDPISL